MIATTNVKLSDVANVLGVSSDLAACYTDEPYNINGFDASYAPVAYRVVSSIANVPSMVPFYLSGIPPYKLGYYRGYQHGMIEPIPWMNVPDYSPSGGTNKVKLRIHRDGTITSLGISNYYMGLVFISATSSYAYTFSTQIKDLLGAAVDYDIGETTKVTAIEIEDVLVPDWLPDGEYTVYPIAASSAIRTKDSWSASLIRLGSETAVLIRSGSAYSVQLSSSASYVSSSYRYTYRSTVTNTGAFKVYLTYKVTINANLDDSVVSTIVSTKTVELAKGETLVLASGDGTQRGMNGNYLRVEWSISATSGGTVQDSGVEKTAFKSV